MTRAILLAALLAAVAPSPGSADPKEAPPPAIEQPGEPVKLVRTLQLLQDQIARGMPDAENARRGLIEAIAARLLAVPREQWSDPRNVDAAIVYVLSGGTPAVLDRLSELDELHTQLVAAVRADALGLGAEGLSLWNRVDPAALPHNLVAPVALAKATWLIASDPAAAAPLLDLARLNAPGTLIEEAAIRRGIEIAARTGDAERFEHLSVRYATRFPRSTYAQAFRARFAEFYLAVAPKAGDGAAEMLDNVLATLPASDRCGVYLEIARRALIGGDVKLSRSAAERALTLAAGPAERPRAEFYVATALALLDDPAATSLPLGSVNAAALDARDRELLGAVTATLEAIHAWPDVVAGPPIEKSGSQRDDDLLAGTAAATAKAREALSAADLVRTGADRKSGT